MFPARIVEAVDVFEEGDLDLATGLPVAAPDEFSLQGFEEAFDGGIVVAIAFSAHRYLEPMPAQHLLIVVSTVLRSAICVMNAAWWRPSDRDGHAQRTQRQILLYAIADGPPNDAPGEKVNDHSQINPPLARPDIGDVACALLVRPARSEVLLQEIRRDVEGVIAVGRALELSAADDLDAILAHKSPDTALADADAQLIQLLSHAWSAVAAKA